MVLVLELGPELVLEQEPELEPVLEQELEPVRELEPVLGPDPEPEPGQVVEVTILGRCRLRLFLLRDLRIE